jgi:hypothetical protein
MAFSRILQDLLEQDRFAKFTKTSNTTATLGSLTLNTAILGAGGLDTGSIAASTLYYVYTIVDSNSIKLIASISSTSPTGFTQYKKVGAFITDSSLNIGKACFFGEILAPKKYKITFSGTMTPPSASNILVTGHTTTEFEAPLLVPSNPANPGLRFPAGYYGKRKIEVYGWGRSDVGSSSNVSIGLTNTPSLGGLGTIWNQQASSSTGERGGVTNILYFEEDTYTAYEQLMYVTISSSPDPAQNQARIIYIECTETFTHQPDWSRI